MLQGQAGITKKNWLSRDELNTSGVIVLDKGHIQAVEEEETAHKTAHKTKLQKSLQIKDLAFIHPTYTTYLTWV